MQLIPRSGLVTSPVLNPFTCWPYFVSMNYCPQNTQEFTSREINHFLQRNNSIERNHKNSKSKHPAKTSARYSFPHPVKQIDLPPVQGCNTPPAHPWPPQNNLSLQPAAHEMIALQTEALLVSEREKKRLQR